MPAIPDNPRRDPRFADVLIRAGAVHPFDGGENVHRSLALRGGEVLAVGRDAAELDGLVGPGTTIIDDPQLVVLPAFHDTHNHQLWTSRDLDALQLRDCTSIPEIVGAIAAQAQGTPRGEWVVTSRSWHESTIDERRLPTAAELDKATTDHPVFVRRGGHVGVANSRALRLAGIDRDTPDPQGGTVVRDAAGNPTGPLIEFPAFAPIGALLPSLTFEDQVDALRRVCALYNSRGIGAVRDPGVYRDDMLVYQALHERGGLSVRSNVMIRLDADWSTDDKITEIERWGVRTGFGDDLLRLGGLKIFLDGGVEGGALSEPYANDPDYRGHLFIDVDELERVVATAVRRGWRVGCHAVGDVAVRTVLDAYERVLRDRPELPAGWLVIEHAFFADAEQRRRAIALGVGVTVQHPLLYSLAGNMLTYWGEARTEQVMPVREWVDEGALVAAGSDCNVTPFDPLLSIWGLVTRGTQTAGPRGPQHAIDRRTAFELYTTAGARLIGEQRRRGALAPGLLADLVAFTADPLSCPLGDLPQLQVAFTMVAGRAVYDPHELFDTGQE